MREIGAADGTGSEFWAAGYAQWMVAASRGDYSLAQQTAAMLLDEAEKAGLVMHVAAGRMMLGLVAFYQGELALSRNCYELAIDAYRPEFADLWRGALVQGFLTSCFIVLPLAEWHGGRFDRALEFRKRGIERATETGHIPSIGNALLFGVLFEAQRGDPEATRDAVEAMLKIATDHHMAFHLAQGSVYGAWASGRISDPSAFVGPLRQAVLGFNGLGLRNCTSWFQGMIADLQWRSGDYDDALRSVGEGLAIAQETGERFSEPFLHLLRGDVLLKRDPSDASPAEAAFRTAIEVATEQGARSYGLRASLALAKLYQSTSRFVEAHDVLAPALDGFAPSPEMPEIEEAQAFLSSLSWGL